MRPSALPSTLLIIALLAAGNSAWGQEGNLGRLFFTPEQRASLDRLRQHSVKQSDEATTGDGVSITLQGVVRRSSGKGTTWVNGAAIDEPLAPPNASISKSHKAVSAVGSENSDIRVGESLNQSTGERRDLLNGGEIQIRQPARR
ncbi:MAG TPA: hypothetical protein PLW86_07750 [Rhodocyclaceae bacterium]|nr:hypothetical protein [Rhodocyclaceae bacterium]